MTKQWRYCTEPINSSSYPEFSLQETTINIIALGRTGDGKSSLLNDLVGKQVFKQKISAKVNKQTIYRNNLSELIFFLL